MVRQKDRLCICLLKSYNDIDVYAARYMKYRGFRDVIGNQFCPYLLFNILWFIGMKIVQTNRVFQLSKRGFDPPSGIVQLFDAFRWKFITWQIRNDAFTG